MNSTRSAHGSKRSPQTLTTDRSPGQPIKRALISLLILTPGLIGFGGGCAHRGGIFGVDCCADIPAGAIPQPAGTKVCAWHAAQVTSALPDQNVFYQADFIGRSVTLSPSALDRISRNVQSNLAVTVPWVIEPSGDAALDAGRIAGVTGELIQRGISSPDVQVALPAALGLTGPQAERVAGSLGGNRNSNRGTGAPLSQASGLGRVGTGFTGSPR